MKAGSAEAADFGARIDYGGVARRCWLVHQRECCLSFDLGRRKGRETAFATSPQ